METRFIDLSLIIEPNESEPVSPHIEYISYEEGANILGKPAGIKKEDFPGGMAISQEHITLTSHSGTHLDAPSHYGPLCEGKPSKSIEEIPLEWCFNNGVVIHANPYIDEPVSAVEIEAYLDNINYVLQPFDVVLINTGADRLWGTPKYFTEFRGVSLEATKWLTNQGIKIIGVDSFGFDPPFERMLNNYRKSKNNQILWPAHLYGRQKEYCQIERLTNLNAIPMSTGFKVACFPIKIKGAGAGWSRVVAIIE